MVVPRSSSPDSPRLPLTVSREFHRHNTSKRKSMFIRLINKIVKYYNRIPKQLRNKYVITITVFVVFMLFFDTHNVMKQVKLQGELNNIRDEVEQYNNEYNTDKQLLQEIKRDRTTLQKIGRERYLMHYPEDDVYYFK